MEIEPPIPSMAALAMTRPMSMFLVQVEIYKTRTATSSISWNRRMRAISILSDDANSSICFSLFKPLSYFPPNLNSPPTPQSPRTLIHLLPLRHLFHQQFFDLRAGRRLIAPLMENHCPPHRPIAPNEKCCRKPIHAVRRGCCTRNEKRRPRDT